MNEELMRAIKDHLTPRAVNAIAEAITLHCQTGTPADSEARWFARGLRVCVLGEKSKPMPKEGELF